MFWGLIMEPNKRYTQTVERPFHVSMATLDISTSDDTPVQVMLCFENRNYLLCNLKKDTSQASLDLNFQEGTKIAFTSNGRGHVHLTGYLIPEEEEMNMDDFEDLEDEEEEEDEEEVPQLVGKKRKALQDDKAMKKLKALAESLSENGEEDSSDDDEENEIEMEDSDDSMEEEQEEEDDDDDVESDEEEEEEDDEEEEEEEKSPVVEKPKGKQNKKQQQQEAKDKAVVNGKDANQQKKNKKEQQQDKQNAKSQEKQAKPDKQEKQAKPEKQEKPAKQEAQQVQKKRVLSGGVSIEELKVGNGTPAKNGKFVSVYYIGKLKNGKKFDASQSGKGFRFRLGSGEVIKGWDIGVAGMKVGGKRRITVPPGMGYGNKGSPPVIPGNSTLVFDVELREVH